MKLTRTVVGALVGLAGGLGASDEASAQADPSQVQALERQLQQLERQYRLSVPEGQPIDERALFDAGASLRAAFFSIDDETSDAHIMRQFDARVYARLEIDGAHRFYGRIKAQYDDWNSGDSFDGDGDDWNDPFLDRLWYEFDLRGLMRAQTGERTDYNVNLKVGKEYFLWGSGLVLSQNLYGGTLDLEFGSIGLVGLVGVTSPLETIDFDASRPAFDDDTERLLAGGMFEWRGDPGHRPYAFFMAQIDENDQGFANLGGAFPTLFQYDSYYAGVGSRGSLGAAWRYRVEFVYEFGEGYSTSLDPVGGGAIPQMKEDISAMAGLVGLTYLFRDKGDSRFDFELSAGSGDDDRLSSSDTFGGNAPNTTDRAFNSLGYVNTGLALAPDVTNLLTVRAGLSTNPFRSSGYFFENMRVGVDGYLFTKIDEDAPISATTNAGDRFVGGEIDVFLSWRMLSDLMFEVRYGVFLPGEAMPDGQDDPRQFFYAGVTYAF